MITYTFQELPESDKKSVLSIAEKMYMKECSLMGVEFRSWNFEVFLKRQILNNFFLIDENYNILITQKYCRSAINFK